MELRIGPLTQIDIQSQRQLVRRPRPRFFVALSVEPCPKRFNILYSSADPTPKTHNVILSSPSSVTHLAGQLHSFWRSYRPTTSAFSHCRRSHSQGAPSIGRSAGVTHVFIAPFVTDSGPRRQRQQQQISLLKQVQACRSTSTKAKVFLFFYNTPNQNQSLLLLFSSGLPDSIDIYESERQKSVLHRCWISDTTLAASHESTNGPRTPGTPWHSLALTTSSSSRRNLAPQRSVS